MIKYNNHLYTLDIQEVETQIDELEELIMNYDPVSIIKDDYEAYLLIGGE